MITSFTASVGANNSVRFSGTVTDDQPPGGITVSITLQSGLVFATVVDEDGNFSTTQTLFGMGRQTVSAVATDAQGAKSAKATAFFTLE